MTGADGDRLRLHPSCTGRSRPRSEGAASIDRDCRSIRWPERADSGRPRTVIAAAVGCRRLGGTVTTLGNLLWIVLAGLWLAIAYVLVGVMFCLTVIGIPLGVEAFKLSGYALWPFGRAVVEVPGRDEGLGCLGNLVWVLVGGWALALMQVILGLELVPHDRGPAVRGCVLPNGQTRLLAVRKDRRPTRPGPSRLSSRYRARATVGAGVLVDVSAPGHKSKSAPRVLLRLLQSRRSSAVPRSGPVIGGAVLCLAVPDIKVAAS